MAYTLEQFDFSTKPKYPWHCWCNGEIWKLELLKDFSDTDNMIDLAKYQAKRRNMQLEFKRVDDGLVVRFSPQFCNKELPLTQQLIFTEEDKKEIAQHLEIVNNVRVSDWSEESSKQGAVTNDSADPQD